MTRTERLAAQQQRQQERLDRERHRLAQLQAQLRDAEAKAHRRRIWHVGQMADAAGLLELSDADLAGLFAMLARLNDGVANPVAVLEALVPHSNGAPHG
jgi:hypothetical protein